MRAISDDALDIIANGGRYTTRLTITKPIPQGDEEGDPAPVYAEPVTVNISPGWSVTERSSIAGPRLGVSSLELLPTDGIDNLFELAGYPGARYNMAVGIVLGATIEWIDVFGGYVVEGSMRRLSLGVKVSLSDGWNYVDDVPLVGEYKISIGAARSTTIVELFTPVIQDVETVVEAAGGYLVAEGVYTGSRGQAAADIARDGLLQVGFNGSGQLVIRERPDLNIDTTPRWSFRSDQGSSVPAPAPPDTPPTIIDGTLERSRPWAESLFNAVTVKPGGSEQTWAAQTAKLGDTSDPRHESYVGLRPIEITSNTIGNACDAVTLAQAELQRRLRGLSETVKLTVLLNPAVEADEVMWVAALPTYDDAGWNGTYIITSVTHAPSAGTTSIEAVSAAGFDVEI